MNSHERGSQARILVVDPEEWCRSFLSSVIKLLGFQEFKMVNSVTEALAAMDDTPFDLIITDQRQPDYQRLLDMTRLRHPDTRFILMLHQRSQQMVYIEQVDIVYKPLSLDEISRKIRYALHQKHLRQAEEEIKRMKKEVLRMFLD